MNTVKGRIVIAAAILLLILGFARVADCCYDFTTMSEEDSSSAYLSSDFTEVLIVQTSPSSTSSTYTTTESTTEVTTTTPSEQTTTTTSPRMPGRSYDVPFTQELQDWISELCSYYEFDEYLIYQIIRVESNYNPLSGNQICKGLMQVHTGYVDHYASINDDYSYVFKDGFNKNEDVFDPYKNVLLGIRVLDDWRGTARSYGYEDVLDWLCFYNAGYSYMDTHNTFYGEWVLSIKLEEIDFSKYEVIG